MAICCTLYKNPVSDHQLNTIMMHDLFVVMSLYMVRCFFVPLTGGYFNTAVTLGVFMNKNSNNKLTAKKFFIYTIAQLIGSAIGVTLSKVIYKVNTGPFSS
jgi:glycerol uptake facilitator-like aquaporin